MLGGVSVEHRGKVLQSVELVQYLIISGQKYESVDGI